MIKSLADAYKSYEEGRLARENRKTHQKAIQHESTLEKLDEPRKGQLITFLDALMMEENANLPTPIRFARRQVKGVVLRIRKRPDYTPRTRKFALLVTKMRRRTESYCDAEF
jgi:hypothetical protein